jgi:hypothetical protein
LDKGLQVIFDPVYNFPPKYARVARHIYDKLESERWGADEVEVDDVVDFDQYVADAGGSISAGANTQRQRNGVLSASDFPADNHPIYGLNGIMHHILRVSGSSQRSYQINPNFRSRDAKVFGHNGLAIGDCWPNQIALLRDGGHGQ